MSFDLKSSYENGGKYEYLAQACSNLNYHRITFFRVPTINLLGTRAMRSPVHILEINCVRKFEIGAKNYLITASEDTKIKIFEIEDQPANLVGSEDQPVNRCIATLNSHISSVKCLDVVTISGSVYIISAGSRAQVIF